MNILRVRAWDKENNEMLYPDDTDKILFEINEYGITTYDVRYLDEYGSFSAELDSVVMQSTGLFDKNGTEIYEGDILSISKNHSKTDSSVFNDEKVNYEVEFLTYNDFEEYADIEHYGWCVTGSIDDWYTRCTLIDAVKLWDAEIVGNIYQDEHLLEED